MNEKYSPRIGVISDDLTGAGDVGAQFAGRGLKAVISTGVESVKETPDGAEVWIINTNSRDISRNKAVKSVKKAVILLKAWNAEYFYKKIDSTLRGNLGAELEVFADELGAESIPFCAAFPDMGKTTIGGVHYVLGERLEETPYAKDTGCESCNSEIRKIIELQMKDSGRIDVKDAATNEDLENMSRGIKGNVFAGAAAFAGYLADSWLTANRKVQPIALSPGPVLVISGSLNPISLEQVKYWEENGSASIIAEDIKEPLDPAKDLLIKTPMLREEGILKKLNKAAYKLWTENKMDRVILNGGDTAYGFMAAAGIKTLNVVKSMAPGIALTEADKKYFILKSGGYGQTDALTSLSRLLGGR
ncbi:MAG: hypothetical protein JXJ19_03810 [Elusimicrobia bacterium]|nr:hypothetical protein [Elusimicrobiota bacterium]